MPDYLDALVARTLGTTLRAAQPLQGGCIGEVARLDLADGRRVVVKVDRSPQPRLDIEGFMLRYLREHSALPVPEVLWCEPQALIMTFAPGDSQFSARSQAHAAALLAGLHEVSADAFGFERATLIGGLEQPNPWTVSWIEFFREHRLRYMAREAHREGVMPEVLLGRILRFSEALDRFITEPESPALLHGDVWTTNVLTSGNRITAFIDPALYFGHPEVELAFTTLFGTFGQAFFDAYGQIRAIEPGFFELRRDIYNLYPLLVHARLFGASYLSGVAATIGKLGF